MMHCNSAQLRRQFLKLTAALPLLALPGCAPGKPFDDVPSGTRWGQAIENLRGRGLVAGTGDNYFSPSMPMTRSEAAVLIVRLDRGVRYTPFNQDADHWGIPWVRQAVAEGWMDERSLYELDEPATRADVAAIVSLAL